MSEYPPTTMMTPIKSAAIDRPTTLDCPTARLTARLLVWEGFKKQATVKEVVKGYTICLREAINKVVKPIGWRHQRFKTYDINDGKFKLEVCIRPLHLPPSRLDQVQIINVSCCHQLYLVHSSSPDSSTVSERLLELCDRLLNPEFTANLRSRSPGPLFTFSPSIEGIVSSVGRKFVRCFSACVLSKYCADIKSSQDM